PFVGVILQAMPRPAGSVRWPSARPPSGGALRGTHARGVFGILAVAAGLALALAGAPRDAAAAPTLDDRRFQQLYIIGVADEIEPALAAYVFRSLKAAKDDGADCVILRIESPGGRVDSSMDIADAVLALPQSVRTIAWVQKEAYSGASMGALACDEIVMA